MDRRVLRSRCQFRQALIELILDKGYEAITVEELTERANTARATFYSHYKDKEDLLASCVSDLSVELREHIDKVRTIDEAGFTGDIYLAVFQHAIEERDMYRVILRGEGDGRAFRQFFDNFRRRAERTYQERAERLGVQTRLPFEVLAHSVTGELLALLTWWIEKEPPYNKEEMSQMARDLGRHGRFWGMGFDKREYLPDLKGEL